MDQQTRLEYGAARRAALFHNPETARHAITAIAHEREKDLDRRFRYFALLCAVVVAVIALSTCGGCIIPQVAHVDARARLEPDQARAAVRLEVLCIQDDPFSDDEDGSPKPPLLKFRGGIGTGVIIDERHVLTAAHVVQCPFPAVIHATLVDGREFVLSVDKEDDDLDLARLTIRTAEYFHANIAPPVVGRALLGDKLCAATAWPERAWKCGEHDHVAATTTGGSEVQWSAPVQHGNSGAGVYSSNGELVGIITELVRCAADIAADQSVPGCAGRATALFRRHADWFAK